MKYRLGEICKIVSGSTPKTNVPDYWDGNIKWITPAEINEDSYYITDTVRKITEKGVKETGLSSFPKGTVILSSRAPIGKVAIAGCEMYCNQGFKNLICSEKINNQYLYWFLKGKTDYLNFLGRGATFKEISKKIVSSIEIDVPSLPDQEHIVAALDSADRMIRFRRRELNLLDNLVKSRFIEMFGIPEEDNHGWGLTVLGSCCEINPRKNNDKRLVPGLKVSFIPMASVSVNGVINTSTIKNYDEVRTGFTYFSEGDVLFAKITPCMENGKGAVASNLCNGIGFGSTEFHVLRPLSGVSDSYWIYTLLSFKNFRQKAASKMTGTAGQKRVPKYFLENYEVSLPPISLQNEFADFVKQVDQMKASVRSALDRSQLLFDALMQQYFG